MHCLTVGKEPRTKEEFPVLGENGILELEVTRYWQSSEECDTTNLRDIIEYLAVLADGCNDIDSGLELIQMGYRLHGLKAPTGLFLYVVDMHGNRIPYNDEYISINPDIWSDITVSLRIDDDEDSNAPDSIAAMKSCLTAMGKQPRYWVDFTIDEFKQFRSACPDIIPVEYTKRLGELPFIEHTVGISANCLTDATLDGALRFLSSGRDCYNDEPPDYMDAFRYKSRLFFYHS